MVKRVVEEYGVCRACGCTDGNACMDDYGIPCSWANDKHTLCTVCEGISETMKNCLSIKWKQASELDYPSNLSRAIGKIKVRGASVQDYINGEWRHPKHRRPSSRRDNPISIVRDLWIRAGYAPKNKEEREAWDFVLGQLYLYAAGKIKGAIVFDCLPMRRANA